MQRENKINVNKTAEFKIQLEPIFYLPPHVDLEDLQADGKLFTDKEVKIVETVDSGQRKSKQQARTRYSPIKIGNETFAIYKGEKHEKSLGKGLYGRTKLVQHHKIGKWYLTKLQDDEKNNNAEFKNLQHVKQGIGVFSWDSRKKGKKQYGIIMELAPGLPLKDIDDDFLNPLQKIDLIISFLEKLVFLHAQNIIHNDLHLGNLLYSLFSKTVTIIDLGKAYKLAENQTFCEGKAFDDHRLAPEVRKEGRYSKASDIFIAGRIIAYLLHFRNKHGERELQREPLIKNPDISKFVETMLDDNYFNRPNAQQALDFFKSMRKEFLPQRFFNKTIALLNVCEFIESDKAGQQKMLRALKTFNEVWLVDADNKYQGFEHAKLLRLLELDHDMTVKDKIFTAPKTKVEELVAEIPRFMEMEESTRPEGSFRHYHYVSAHLPLSDLTPMGVKFIYVKKGASTADYKKQMMEHFKKKMLPTNHCAYIISRLQKEAERLGTTYKDKKGFAKERADERASALIQAQKLFNDKMTYQDTFSQLDDLRGQMTHTNSVKNWLAKKLPELLTPSSTGQDQITDIAQKIGLIP